MSILPNLWKIRINLVREYENSLNPGHTWYSNFFLDRLSYSIINFEEIHKHLENSRLFSENNHPFLAMIALLAEQSSAWIVFQNCILSIDTSTMQTTGYLIRHIWR